MTTVYPPGRWQAHASTDPTDFMRHQVTVYLRLSAHDGVRMATALLAPFGEPCDPLLASDDPPPPFLTLPIEAAEALFEALAVRFVGTSDVLRLHRDLLAERKRVDALIAGIGQLGGKAP